jgi:hypothetical protein
VFTNIEKHAENVAGSQANTASSWSSCSALPPYILIPFLPRFVRLSQERIAGS